jgi:PEP-CTERM motif
MRNVRIWALAVLVLCSAPATALAIPVAHLQMWGDPEDYIGGGLTYDFTYQNPGITISATLPPGGGPALAIYIGLDRTALVSAVPVNWDVRLQFSTIQLGLPLQPGTYLDAQRACCAQPGHPGLDVGIHSRGSNTVTGQFTISEFDFDPDELLLRNMVADFEQHSEGLPAALRGHFEYRLSGIPEPSTAALLGVGLLGLAVAARRREQAPRFASSSS